MGCFSTKAAPLGWPGLRSAGLAVGLVFALGLAAAFADDVPAPSVPAPAANDPQEAASMQAFGTKMPDCIEWTDSCRICKRDSAGVPQCSTPGIACLPEATICRATKTSGETKAP